MILEDMSAVLCCIMFLPFLHIVPENIVNIACCEQLVVSSIASNNSHLGYRGLSRVFVAGSWGFGCSCHLCWDLDLMLAMFGTDSGAVRQCGSGEFFAQFCPGQYPMEMSFTVVAKGQCDPAKGTQSVMAVLKLQGECSWAILLRCWRASGMVNKWPWPVVPMPAVSQPWIMVTETQITWVIN